MDTQFNKLHWSLVFSVNLIVPCLFAAAIVNPGGWIGVVAAIGACWLAGARCCERYRVLTQSLIVGGILVGVSQLIAIPQFMAGVFGLGFTQALGLADRWDPPLGVISNPVGGFVAAAITGGLLMG